MVADVEHLIAGTRIGEVGVHLCSGKFLDPVDQLQQRSRVRASAANVEDLAGSPGMILAHRVHGFDEIAYPEHVARLASVSIDGDRVALQR